LGWIAGIFTYVIIWWAVLFAVLPWGVRRPDSPEPGHDPGAPERPMLLKKAIATSLISVVVWLAVYFLVTTDYVRFRPR
jgi:predicted secreted protein